MQAEMVASDLPLPSAEWLRKVPVVDLSELLAAAAAKSDAYIAPLGEAKDPDALTRINSAALALARGLRRAGLSIALGDGSFRLKKSFEAADKVARSIVILGEDELRSGILTVKDFATGTQTKVPRAELAAHLGKPPAR